VEVFDDISRPDGYLLAVTADYLGADDFTSVAALPVIERTAGDESFDATATVLDRLNHVVELPRFRRNGGASHRWSTVSDKIGANDTIRTYILANSAGPARHFPE
jgi:hypothetical protein